jgi:hypothetical protein
MDAERHPAHLEILRSLAFLLNSPTTHDEHRHLMKM